MRCPLRPRPSAWLGLGVPGRFPWIQVCLLGITKLGQHATILIFLEIEGARSLQRAQPGLSNTY